MAKKMSKQAKRRLTLLTPILFLALGYLLFTIGSNVIEMYKLQKEETKLKEELKTLKGESENLKTEINKLQDKDYIARYARENYLYTKDGEYVIKIDPDKEKKKKQKLTINDKYVIYGGYSLGALIILILLIKHHKKRKKKT
ncbi:MAG: septum formation initiator family protein [Bacilli bacterium]|nr:septum formation initiator family protein [Bacilli bacterium]